MIYILLLLYFIVEIPYKSLIFAVFMPIKEKIANTFVSAILNSNGATGRIRTSTPIQRLILSQVCLPVSTQWHALIL